MLGGIRSRFTYANVMASIAVFIALGAGAYAAGLARNSVKSKHIVNDQVKSEDVAERTLRGIDADSVNGIEGREIFVGMPVPAGTVVGPPVVVLDDDFRLRLSCFHPLNSPQTTMAQLLADDADGDEEHGLGTMSLTKGPSTVEAGGFSSFGASVGVTAAFGSGQLVYRTDSGATTTFTFALVTDQGGIDFGTTDNCFVYGHLQRS